MGARSLFSLFSSKESVLLLFFLEEKNGQLAREAQALRRTDAGTSCVVVGRNTTAGMPPSSALSLPVSAAPARLLSRASRPRKRKSSAEQLPTCAPAAFADVPHKTDGSHTNRPFFCSGQDTQESIYSQINQLPRNVFCFFSSRKEIVPLLFFLEENKQKKIKCGTVALRCFCCFRQRAAQNGRFTYEPSVFSFLAGRAEEHLFSDKSTAPQCLLFLFFKKRNRSPVEEKKTFSCRT